MDYTKKCILCKCNDAFKDKNTFYKLPIINYRGKTEDTDEYFAEVIAGFLCANIDEFKNGIDTINRGTTYYTKSHENVIINPDSNREEENIAKSMYHKEYAFIGKIIDYQTPLKNSRADDAGKIDLLSYDGTTLRILELKKPDSEETMLRCVLEGFTYWKTVDKAKLLLDFKLPGDTVVKACPFVFKGKVQYNEMKETRPNLKRLMELLDSKPYYISGEDGKYIVTKE